MSKLEMKDIQNTVKDYDYKINKVGVNNIRFPINVQTMEGNLVTTVASFDMAVSLSRYLKGINMSRLPLLLEELSGHGWVPDELQDVLGLMAQKLECNDAYIDMSFDYFIKKKAPLTEYEGTMPYKCRFEASLNEINENSCGRYDFILTVEIPVTTLCPCSKEISDHSAHNQRGYVKVSLRYNQMVWIEEIIQMVEAVSSCEIYPVLKRADEKYVTEKAYANPRFVEDMVRLAAQKLDADERITWFKVSSRHQESIHPHDAYAVFEKCKCDKTNKQRMREIR